MQQITIHDQDTLLFQGAIAELTLLGVGIECHFGIIQNLKTNRGKFKQLTFKLQSDCCEDIKGQLSVHSMRRTKQDHCLICFRFCQPAANTLRQVKSLIASVPATNIITSLPVSHKDNNAANITDNVAMLR